MRKLALIVMVGMALPSAAKADQNANTKATVSTLVFSQAAVISRAALDQDKAVPRVDKDAVEVIGTVRDIYQITDRCSGNSVMVVWIASSAAPLNPVGGGCAGPSLSACASLRIGQRVRFQGLLLTLPDPTTPGFNACDQGTWFLPKAPLQTFLVTKVLK
jgi:hypothetical protein